MRPVYDDELIRLDPVFRRAWGIRAGDHVLDIGCGSGQTTCDAARLASAGTALGIDISPTAIERARQLSRSLANVTFECGDAQVRHFPGGHFDLVLSRFGVMFFRDPARAFANIARALRPGGRLVTMTWQAREDNEWDATIRDALAEAGAPPVSQGNAAFSLADPPAVTDLLESAGFADVSFTDVREPVYYGLNADAALDWVCGFASTKAMLSALDSPAKADALRRLRNAFTTHLASSGVWFGSRSWVIAARRR